MRHYEVLKWPLTQPRALTASLGLRQFYFSHICGDKKIWRIIIVVVGKWRGLVKRVQEKANNICRN